MVLVRRIHGLAQMAMSKQFRLLPCILVDAGYSAPLPSWLPWVCGVVWCMCVDPFCSWFWCSIHILVCMVHMGSAIACRYAAV